MFRDETAARDTIRVLIVDDHPMIRELIRLSCGASRFVRVVGEAASGEEAVELCRRTRPDVVILDLHLPGFDGREVIRRLKADGTDARILVVTAQADPAVLFDCGRLGADGFIGKTEAVTSIVDHLHALERERTPSRDADDETRARPAAEPPAGKKASPELTGRERQVLALLAEGLTNRQIASRLKLSCRTVEWFVQQLYRKLDATNRVEALARAVSLRLVDFQARSSA